MKTNEIVEKLVTICCQFNRVLSSFESIGIVSGAFDRVPGWTEASDMLRDLVLDVLGIPPDTTMRPDCAAVFEQFDDCPDECELMLPPDFYARDYWTDFLGRVEEGTIPLTDLLNEAEKEKREREQQRPHHDH